MNFRWKMFISYCVLAVGMSASFYVYANRFLEKRLVDESRQGLLAEAKMVGIILEEGTVPDTLQQKSERISRASRARVTIMKTDGTVLADSGIRAEQVSGIENHFSRPEVQAALKQEIGESQRYSQTLKTDMLYIAMLCKLGNQNVILRLALPLEHLNESRASLHRMLAAAAGGALFLALFLSLLFSNLISRPLRIMADMASRFGVGDHGVRMPVSTDDETGYLARVLNEMADRLETQVQRLSDDKEKLDAIMNCIGEGLIVIDQTGKIVLASPAFNKLFALDFRPEGQLLLEVSRHPVIVSCWNTAESCMDEFSEEIRLESTGKILLSHWVPLVVRGSRNGVVAVFLDITATKKLETVRQDFLANVSHELRTPIAVIKGYAETLLEQDLVNSAPEQASRFIATINTHTGRLNRLLEDILALSRLEDTGTGLDLGPVNMYQLLEKVSELLQDKADAKGLSLYVEQSSAIIPSVMADRERIEQVLVNLVDNAIKYTAQGEVRLSAAHVGDMLEINISDTGIGIPEKDQSRVFERFYRVDAARSRELGGTGLGLAIVKHIVLLHGGNVSMKSAPGKGSVFTFSLKTS